MLCIAALLALATPSQAVDREGVPIRGDRLSGHVLPIEPVRGDIAIHSLRATAWNVDDTRRLLLRGDVRVTIAGRGFTAEAATVWINRIPSRDGLINQIAVYFYRVTDPTMPAGSGIVGEDVLVTGSTRGAVTLDIALLVTEQPPRSALLRRGEARLREQLQRAVAGEQPLRWRPQVHQPPQHDEFIPVPGGRVQPEDVQLPERFEPPPREDPTPWLGRPEGVVRYSAEHVEIVTGEHENTITLIGPLMVDYLADDRVDRWQRLTLTAQRGVIFTDPGPLDEFAGGSMSARSIRGMYLEGNVIARANVDDYMIRSPRVYYDFRRAEAIMLDSVMRTYSRDLDVLIYARATEMRQIAENQWEARRAQVSTSEFFKPHIAIGSDRMTITERPGNADEPPSTHIDARGLTLRTQDVPFFYWPRFAGTIGDMPLRSITGSTRDEDGLGVLTTWNLFALLGVEPPPDVDIAWRLDGFTKRGVGTGVEVTYGDRRNEGALDAYGMYDEGTDRTSTGQRVEPANEFRGVVLWEHQTRFNPDWTAQFQGSLISDESFISAWREDDFRERREYETSAYLKGQSDNSAFTILAKHELNDFVSNDYLLASRQYQVDKLPEITYRRYGDSLADVMTYSMENRLSRARLVMQRTTPREAGVRGRAFGLDDDDRIDRALRELGLPRRYVNRADSRHELAVPLQFGPVKVVPFAVGRLTAYDDEFSDISDQGDNFRLFGAVGMTVSTQFQRVNNAVENRLFDLHRMRHIIEPRLTAWYGHSTIAQGDLPIFDEEVESVGDGTVLQVGVRNTFQTQRGGPGRWRSVDFFMLDTAVVLHSSNVDRQSPTPQFFDARPEHSQFGDHFKTSMMWLLSDTFSIVGQGTYDFDESHIARGSVGAALRHSPVLSTYLEYRYIEASRNELLEISWNYRMTPKYSVMLRPQWDLREDEFRAVTARVIRTFPDFDLILQARYDRIRDDFTLGATVGLVQF